jgi:opacity protein-like surface antigen
MMGSTAMKTTMDGAGRVTALIVLATTFTAGPAAAQALNDKYWIEVSAYFPKANTTVSVSRPSFPGTEIDMESDLDLDENETLPAIYAGARLGERWVVAGEYYGLDRQGSRTIERDINFDGATFPVGVEVSSKMKSNIYRLTVGYSFIRTDRAELGAAIGLHATNFEFSLQGDADVDIGVIRRQNQKRTFLAPMPTVGVFGTYEVTPKVILTGRADYLSLDVGDYDGSILNAQAAIAYKVTDMIEIGAAYRYVDYGLDVDKSRYTASVDYDFSGPAVFIRAGFR